ncbi:MAG: hypothetical protein HRU70_03985 [Phycisphaeraceae bacterium]|nr:MAG: hypothetical protein HRU70_03985 [Phycisphaeraceae bacterium]
MICRFMLATVLLGGLVIPPGCRGAADRVPAGVRGEAVPRTSFNEHWLAGRLGRPAPADPAPPGVEPTEPTFDDPRSVLRWVLSRSPQPAVVYPTEGYYYYTLALGPRTISGNIRLADAAHGRFSVGYFDPLHPADSRSAHYRDGEPGITLRHDPSTRRVVLRADGIERTYLLDASALDPPPMTLLEGERLITGLRDESGYALVLLYHAPSRGMYYTLNPSLATPEPLDGFTVGPHRLRVGRESRFIFFHHPPTGRDVLVAVHRDHIRRNTWFDGPFDQFPPHLRLRETLEEAYPYVIDAGGIDDNGNFLALAGQRLAISPHLEYDSADELARALAATLRVDPGPAAWLAATYEPKRDWRPPPAPIGPDLASPGAHRADRSVAWPANHWGHASARWPSGHDAALSPGWPANHDAATSPRSTPE